MTAKEYLRKHLGSVFHYEDKTEEECLHWLIRSHEAYKAKLIATHSKGVNCYRYFCTTPELRKIWDEYQAWYLEQQKVGKLVVRTIGPWPTDRDDIQIKEAWEK